MKVSCRSVLFNSQTYLYTPVMGNANFSLLSIKRKHLFPNQLFAIACLLIFFLGTPSAYAQLTYNTRSDSKRVIPPGSGQEHALDFVFVKAFYFVQFGVYSLETDRNTIKSPNVNEQIWLIEHFNTQVRGENWNGAYYIVKPCQSEGEARAYAEYCRSIGLDCWYNAALSDVPFTLHAFSF